MEVVRSLAPDVTEAIGFDLTSFAATLNGTVILPGDEAYDAARQIRSTAADKRPTLIVRAADASDVARTVALAAETGLELAVRSGGHSLAAHSTSDGGIVLDLSPMKGILIDPARRLAWVQPGLTAGEITSALSDHGLAIPFGDTASVGVGGITTGGGIGFLARKYGLSIDNLAAAEIVTADGRLLTIDDARHPDLFWAVRGGGGNFGVITRFVFRLVPVSNVVGGGLVLPATPEVLAGLAAAADAAPDDLTTITFVMHAPPAPFIPEHRVGELVAMILAVFDGGEEDATAAFAPFRALAEPVADLIGPMPYPAIYQFTAEAEARAAEVVRSFMTDEIDLAFARTIVDHLERATSPAGMVQIRVFGGEMGRVPSGATAFAHRDAKVLFTVITPYEGDPEHHVAWTTALYEALVPRATGAYVNFLESEGDDRIREAYPGGTYDRLAAIKRRYDPSNVFRLNQNIKPV